MASRRWQPAPTGLSPAEIRQAYNVDQVSFNNGTIAGDGSGTTIAIVDAYDEPNVQSDLHEFDVQFGLPDPVLTTVNQSGGTSLPAGSSGWGLEIALDVEWAHAIAPQANILLVEANSASLSNMFTAVDYARQAAGVVAVSMSWTTGEFSGEKADDSRFTTPVGHSGVTFVAASGDSGAPVGYPSISPTVLSVGGTTLSLNDQTYASESAWSGSGGGISAQESRPSYQKGIVTQSATFRANPDVAYDADPSSGVSVYDSYGRSPTTPWLKVGGTSAGAPQWSALVAVADQGRMLAGKGALDGATQTLPILYAMSASNFHDVTTGASTGKPAYSATVGYDLVTGRGSPIADAVVSGLVQPPLMVAAAAHATPSPVTGTTASLSVLGADDNGESDLTYTWATTGSPPAAVTFSANGTNAAKNTTATFQVAGAYTFIVTISDTTGRTATSVVGLTVSQTLTSISVTPASMDLLPKQKQQFTATAKDQFGDIFATSPKFTWRTTAGTITAGGLLTTPNKAVSSASVSASSGGASGAVAFSVHVPAPPQDTIGLFAPNPSMTFLRNTNDGGNANIMFAYGAANAGWRPIAGDWNGDGVVSVGLYNPATSVFYLRNTNGTGAANMTFAYGAAHAGWLPIAGDWNGDGKDTIGLYNPATSTFYLRNTNSTGAADVTFAYGTAGAGWLPVVGDWNGNGTDTVGLYNPTTSVFYLRNTNSSGSPSLKFAYGAAHAGWLPIAGDWNGDKKDTIGLYDPAASVFYLRNTNTKGYADLTFAYGAAHAGWLPIAGDWDGTTPAARATTALATPASQPVAETLAHSMTVGLSDTSLSEPEVATYGPVTAAAPAQKAAIPRPDSVDPSGTIDPGAVDSIDLLAVVEQELGRIDDVLPADPT